MLDREIAVFSCTFFNPRRTFFYKGFMSNLLAFITFNGQKLLKTLTNFRFTLIVATFLIVIILLIVLPKINGKFKTKELTFAAASVALSFVLSFIKVKVGVNGGSVTLLSLAPIILYSYKFGMLKGLTVGIVHGLLQFIESPEIYTYLTFFLDYVFAFSGVFIASVFKKIIKNETTALLLGAFSVYVIRLIFATASGIFYYEDMAFGAALVASLAYNAAYIAPDMILCLVFLVAFSFTSAFRRIYGKNSEEFYN